MAKTSYRPEEIIAKLRQVAVLGIALSACEVGGNVPSGIEGQPDPTPAIVAPGACKDVPLPGYKVAVAADDVPAEIAAFLGVRSGAWVGKKGQLCHVLIVLKVDADSDARVIFSTGKDSVNGLYHHLPGKIVGDLLTLITDGYDITYKLLPDGSFYGTYKGNGKIASGIFTM